MSNDFQVSGTNAAAPFTLKLHRGDGMALVAMNWRNGTPPDDFVGFAIEYREPGGSEYFALKNRICFPGVDGAVDPERRSTRESPIQKFRWVHFPRNADLPGAFEYRITPVFMDAQDNLSYGEPQEVAIELRRDTYPGVLNVAYTRGFVSSQAFVDRYTQGGGVSALIPSKADDGLDFVPTHPRAAEALAWMGFEAREAILEVLDGAIADGQAQVRVVAYDLNERDIVERLEQLGGRLKVIIDDSGAHGEDDSAETAAASRLEASAGANRVKRQRMGKLQHNKTIVVDGPLGKVAVCGSTNFSWRGFFVQANHALVLRGETAIAPFRRAFDSYWTDGSVAAFAATPSARWTDLQLAGIEAKVAFSPHNQANALLKAVADDIEDHTGSSLFYSLAFLYQTGGNVREAIEKISQDDSKFVYGISDRKVGGGLDLQSPDGNVSPVYPAVLSDNLPEPFKSEPVGGAGVRMHHKFVVIDFDQPTARVYLGSYNFSTPADTQNGENLLLISDRRIAVSFVVEALRIFDHYRFRVVQQQAEDAHRKLQLARPPRAPGDEAWWKKDYTNVRRIRDRELFA